MPKEIGVAILGVGNVASTFMQRVHFYQFCNRKSGKKTRFIKPSNEELLRMKAVHPKLNSKYLKDADALLKEDDVQASEKYWGAFAQMVKAVAAAKGIKLGEYRNIIEFVQELSKEYSDLNLTDALAKARYLHTNFYEDELPHEVIAAYAGIEGNDCKLNNLL